MCVTFVDADANAEGTTIALHENCSDELHVKSTDICLKGIWLLIPFQQTSVFRWEKKIYPDYVHMHMLFSNIKNAKLIG